MEVPCLFALALVDGNVALRSEFSRVPQYLIAAWTQRLRSLHVCDYMFALCTEVALRTEFSRVPQYLIAAWTQILRSLHVCDYMFALCTEEYELGEQKSLLKYLPT